MSFRTETIGDIEVVHINHGQLSDETTNRTLGDLIQQHIEGQERQKILLNFSNVDFISSSMVGRLITLKKVNHKRGIELRVCSVSADIREVLRMVRFEMIMPIHETQPEAITAFGGSTPPTPTRRVDAELIESLKQKSEAGDAESQFELGNCYETGDGVKQNPQRANYWFQKAADQGHVEAIINIANSFAYGMNNNQDFGQALPYYEAAAQAGHPDSQYMVGLALHHGLAGETNYELAVDWYRKSAAQGHAEAAQKLQELESSGT